MADPVQARSLAGLNDLADNPPQHLNSHLRHQPREPLVMYVARVPGSRDVFLTTMKPRDKVVGAYDVESSLYYCHLETAEDDVLRAELDGDLCRTDGAEEHPPVLSESPPAHHEHPGLSESPPALSASPPAAPFPAAQADPSPKPALPARPPPAPPSAPSQEARPAISRKPVSADASRRLSLPALPARPHGPRPMHAPSRPSGKENEAPPALRTKPPLPPRQNTQTPADASPPRLPRHSVAGPTAARPPVPPRPSSYAPPKEAGASARPPVPPPVPPRRPGSAGSAAAAVAAPARASRGFAVTLIRRDPCSGEQWNVGRMRRGAGADGGVLLELCAPGYAKFDAAPLEEGKPPEGEEQQSSLGLDGAGEPPFARMLKLRGKQQQQQDVAAGEAVLPFSFASPWDGPCWFVTGATGRSLRCRHVFPPPVAEDARLVALGSAPVSELRLNLPVVGRKRQHQHQQVRRQSQVGGMGGGFDGGVFGDDGRMDLSLGRERAGGGFGGKKAKLAKVIVEGEGLLMLDLVVLANMAIWWSVSEEGLA